MPSALACGLVYDPTTMLTTPLGEPPSSTTGPLSLVTKSAKPSPSMSAKLHHDDILGALCVPWVANCHVALAIGLWTPASTVNRRQNTIPVGSVEPTVTLVPETSDDQ